MKHIILLIILVSGVLLFMHSNNAQGQCIHDDDWPVKPCLDTPPYSESELKQTWDQYYQLKGNAWMEMKKAEMDDAIKNGILKEWYEYGKDSNNFANSNVWSYYHVYGQAPNLLPYYNGTVTRNDLTPIITYYYISYGTITLIGSSTGLACVLGFLIYRKMSIRHAGK